MTKTRNHWYYGHFGQDFSQKNSDYETQRDNWMYVYFGLSTLRIPNNVDDDFVYFVIKTG